MGLGDIRSIGDFGGWVQHAAEDTEQWGLDRVGQALRGGGKAARGLLFEGLGINPYVLVAMGLVALIVVKKL